MNIGCYFQRTNPVIMELLTSDYSPPNATQILKSLSEKVVHAKFLIGKCSNQVSSVPDPEVSSIIEQLIGVIRNIGESLNLIPSSVFADQEYAEIAVRSISREMKDAHFEISHNQIQVSEAKKSQLQFPPFELAVLKLESTETDLYTVDQVSTEVSQSFDMPNTINFLSGRDYSGQRNHDSSSSESSKTTPRLDEYMEPLYETFFCPLTKDIMNDPVTVANGVTYERRAITEWFKKLGDTAEDVVCPTTGEKLVTTDLNTNIALKTTIQEWTERNEAARIKVARGSFVIYLCRKKTYTKVQVRKIGVLPLLSQLIIHKDKKVRCMTLATLQLLVENDDEAKDMIAKKKTITIIITMLSSNHLPERHKIGSIAGAILMLITIKFNQSLDAFTAESANKILRNLEKSPKNIKCMAENGLLEPLLNHLIDGSEDMQMQMGAYLGVIVLGHDSETYVAERASSTLIKMVQSEKSLTRKVAFNGLAKISSYQRNSNTLVEAGIVPIMIEEMFTRKIDSGRLNSKKESVAILANLLDSGILLENIKVNTHGHTMTSHYFIFHCLIKYPKSTSTVVSAIKETDASYTLIEFLDSPSEELGIETLKLLLTLTTYMGHTLADRLCNTKDQPENLIKIPPETAQLTEKIVIAAKFLALLPHQNLPLNLALLYTGRIPAVIQIINEIQISGTRTSRFTNLYLEGLVGILVRFTTTLYERQILQLASSCNFTLVLTQLLMRGTSDEVQRLSAIGLEKLSVQSITLSKPPQIKRTKFMKLFYIPRLLLFLTKQKQKKIQVCSVHKGVCSSETTFCLVDANAVERLLACLYHENGEVVEAALSAITTLLDDKVDVEMSVNMLNEMNIVKHVLSVLKEQKQQEGLWQKSFLIIEKFLMKGGNRSNSDISQDRFLPSTLVNAFHHGDELTKQMAEKILRHMKKIPYYSSEFV
ncbi:hypothetical protein MKW92_039649 [Papaver armeniacum]|nr:hypothetical protein MKW92_039649 [Papaver armeniacum]